MRKAKELSKVLFKLLGDKGGEGWQELLKKKIGYEIFKEYFNCQEENYESFYGKISQDPKKLEKFNDVVKFYYFWCRRPSVFDVLRPEFKLIVMFSIIEDLMQEAYIPLSDWLRSEVKKGRKINVDNTEALEKILQEYFSQHGSKKSILSFFKKYYDSETIEELKASIEYWDDRSNKSVPSQNLEEIVEFLESIRNQFIHKATDIEIGSRDEYEEAAEGHVNLSAALITRIRKKNYIIDIERVHIENLLHGFEKGLINFFSR